MLLSSSALLPLLLALVPLVSLVFAADCRYYNADDAANANNWWYNGAPMKDLGGGVYAVDNLYSGVRVHLQVTADVNGRDSIKALHSNGFRQFKVRMLDENLNDQVSTKATCMSVTDGHCVFQLTDDNFLSPGHLLG